MANVEPETVEIPKAHFDLYQRAYGLLGKLVNNKEVGTRVKRDIMKVDETIKFPDLDVADSYAEPLKAEIELTKKELAELKKERAEEKTKAEEKETLGDIYAKIDATVKKRKLTDEGREGLIKTMKERQIADPDAAALVYLDSLPKPKAARPSGHSSNRWDMYKGLDGENKEQQDAETKRLLADPMQFLDDKIVEILDEDQEAA